MTTQLHSHPYHGPIMSSIKDQSMPNLHPGPRGLGLHSLPEACLLEGGVSDCRHHHQALQMQNEVSPPQKVMSPQHQARYDNQGTRQLPLSFQRLTMPQYLQYYMIPSRAQYPEVCLFPHITTRNFIAHIVNFH